MDCMESRHGHAVRSLLCDPHKCLVGDVTVSRAGAVIVDINSILYSGYTMPRRTINYRHGL